jgi:Ca2+-transporting ATPase
MTPASAAPHQTTEQPVDWHAHDIPYALKLMQVNPKQGLSVAEVQMRMSRHGPNALTETKEESIWLLLGRQFIQPLVLILLLAVIVTALLGEWLDSSVILAVVLLNSLIGFVQENKARKAISALHRQLVSQATARRDGQLRKLPARELVPGDIIVLEAGDRVPADVRLIKLRELTIDEAALTGESLPVEKKTMQLAADTQLADRHNMAFAGTHVTRGQAEALVVATGDSSEMGRISELLASTSELETPLTKKISVFSHWLLLAILILAVLTFAAGALRGRDLLESFMAAVALTVGAIPEGLPAAITIMLAIGVSKMAKRRAIIRKLPAVETLGSTNVICSDKTGTLTQNQMTAVTIFAGLESFEVSGAGYAPEGALLREGQPVSLDQNPALAQCLLTGLLCNDSRLLRPTADKSWDIEGDPTEAALLVAALKGGLTLESALQSEPRLDTLPFASELQYMATLHQQSPKQNIVRMKGSVEAILQRADRMLDRDGREEPLDVARVESMVATMASEGIRVLALAMKELDTGAELNHENVGQGLMFLGLQGLIDPPREEAKAAVQICQDAGIKIKMITGDHVLTAQAIAEQLGLQGTRRQGRLVAISGRELQDMSDEQLQEQVLEQAVFARVSPEQKLRLVLALQKKGAVVAMTGDGVNDGPALRQANIGVAMGITGTDVAKEAADMVLTDDNFASIEAAVEEGRTVFDNLTKFIVWTLPTNVGEALIVLGAMLFAAGLPITPVQILWINMTTSVFLGLTLTFEDKADDIMQRPPRRLDEPIINFDLTMRTLFVGVLLMIAGFGLYEWAIKAGYDAAQAQTVTVNAIVAGEAFYLFNCRSLIKPLAFREIFTNRWMLMGVGVMFLLQLLFTHAQPMQAVFGTQDIGWEAWAMVFAAGLIIFTLVNIEKQIRWRLSLRDRQSKASSSRPSEAVQRR